MKIIPVLAGLFLLAACNNDSKTVTVTDEETGTKTTMDVNNSAKDASNFEEKIKELQQLSPLGLDEMKALLPETLSGASRSDMSVQQAMGASFAKASYQVNDNSSVELGIFDCAGQAGAGIYSMQYLTLMNFQQESETEVTKTVDFNGAKAIEKYQKDGSEASFHWLAKDRFLVSLEGDNMTLDEVKKIAGMLKF